MKKQLTLIAICSLLLSSCSSIGGEEEHRSEIGKIQHSGELDVIAHSPTVIPGNPIIDGAGKSCIHLTILNNSQEDVNFSPPRDMILSKKGTGETMPVSQYDENNTPIKEVDIPPQSVRHNKVCFDTTFSYNYQLSYIPLSDRSERIDWIWEAGQ